MAKGRPRDPGRERRGTGNRPQTGQEQALILSPVPEDLIGVAPPDDLPAEVGDLWNAIVEDMVAARSLRKPDLILVRAYCEAAFVHAEASAQVHALGVMVTGPMGGPIANPMIKVQKDAAATLRQLSDVLGLNPLARIRGNLMQVAGASMIVGIRDRLLDRLLAAETDTPPAAIAAAKTPAKRSTPARSRKTPPK